MRLTFKIIFAVIFLLSASAIARAEVAQKETQGFVYYLYTPPSYNPSQKYPLIIALHWSTGRGTDMIERWQEPAEKKKYIVACPNSYNYMGWEMSEYKDIFRMVAEIEKEYSIDTSRIFLVGFSSGATFSYYLGLNHPDKFRALASFAGSLKWLGSAAHLNKNPKRHIPVFIIHGNRDNVVPISDSEYAKKRLEKFGYEVKYMELKGEQHNYSPHISWAIINWFEKMK